MTAMLKNKYYIVASYKGHDLEKDNKITNFSPNEKSGSGFCFENGRRDISFSFETQVSLEDKVKEFRKIAKEKKIRVKIEGYEYL